MRDARGGSRLGENAAGTGEVRRSPELNRVRPASPEEARFFLPDTFFILNEGMERDRNQYIFIQKMLKKSETKLEETSIAAIDTMDDTYPSLFHAY